MRKVLALVAGALILLAANLTILQKERLLAAGETVYLRLAPVDPRSLMQGDYMALRFEAAEAAERALQGTPPATGRLVLRLDARGVGHFQRFHGGEALAADERLLRYRGRRHGLFLVTDAYFFQEGDGPRYEAARFGEFRLAADGEALLVGLRDEQLGRLPRASE